MSKMSQYAMTLQTAGRLAVDIDPEPPLPDDPTIDDAPPAGGDDSAHPWVREEKPNE